MSQTQYYIPTPKTPTRQLAHDDRLWIQTLYYEAGFTQAQIVLQCNFTRAQIQYALNHRLTPQKHLRGQKAVLNTPQRKRSIEWVTALATNRPVAWRDILALLEFNCGIKAIRTAFKKEGYVRRITQRKPPLSEQNKKDCLE